jgi:hypothetical protein
MYSPGRYSRRIAQNRLHTTNRSHFNLLPETMRFNCFVRVVQCLGAAPLQAVQQLSLKGSHPGQGAHGLWPTSCRRSMSHALHEETGNTRYMRCMMRQVTHYNIGGSLCLLA